MEARAGQGHPPLRRPDGARPRVLIIDDEPLLRRLLQRCLRDQCEVSDCEGGQEAISRLSADPSYDVILCDVMMPVGAEQVYRAVTARHPQLAPRFVFLSGAVFDSNAQEFLGTLPNRCIDKPFDVETLLDVVFAQLRA